MVPDDGKKRCIIWVREAENDLPLLILQETRRAVLHEDVKVENVRFRVGDACRLPKELAPVDAILAANLICRLPDPSLFLNDLPRLVKPGGIVVLTTPFSWLEAWTPKQRWLGGCATPRQ